MPRSAPAASRSRSDYDVPTAPGHARAPELSLNPEGGVPGRRTVTITGHGAEGYASRNGTRPSAAARHSQVKRHERPGFRPDRVAMWAVLLGVVMMIAAVTSSHAAVIAAHHGVISGSPAPVIAAPPARSLPVRLY